MTYFLQDASLSSYTELISAYKEGSMKDVDVYAAACTNTGLILEVTQSTLLLIVCDLRISVMGVAEQSQAP